MATEPVVREGGAQAPPADGAAQRGLAVARRFVPAGTDPYETVEWEIRSAVISGEGGETVFEQRDVEVPKPWSQLATNVVVSKYFRGPLGTPQRERSVRQLIGRVVSTIGEWGEAQGYFATPGDRAAFADELTHLLLHQKASFNSPVWFNMGVEPKPQCSACFILCKAEEERKAWALIAAGYDASLDGPAYGSIFFQNANNSVRVTDDFMRAALEGRPWSTRYVTNGAVAETRPARDLLRLIAEATWQCGDPGMQF